MILDKDLIQKINLFEELTHATVKEVFNSNGFLIIVNFGDVGKAVGKNGNNIKRYSDMIKERVKIVEYNSDYLMFLKNLIMPLKVDKIFGLRNLRFLSCQIYLMASKNLSL